MARAGYSAAPAAAPPPAAPGAAAAAAVGPAARAETEGADRYSAAWWLPKLQSHCVASRVIDLCKHPNFIAWLQCGSSLQLPASMAAAEWRAKKEDYGSYTGEDAWESGSDAEDPDAAPVPEFPELVSELRGCIREFGAVFPTSDRAAPADAAWAVASGTALRCDSAAEVVTVLKASAAVTADWEGRCSPCIVLRKWHPIDPGAEFRAVVRGGRLAGVSQKRLNQFFPFLLDPVEQHRVLGAVTSLHAAIQAAAAFPAPDCCFDCFLGERGAGQLLGFHGPGEEELLLFSGDEEALAPGGEVPLRVLQSTDEIPDCGFGARLKCGVPADLSDPAFMAAAAEELDRRDGGAAAASADEFAELLRRAAAAAAAEGQPVADR
eukprot:TRINITY_DN6127_c2_g1_i2.p1 TRINITY_DN6127_c2_g1~~TRINITY_DN6127_c2_g1_i2.p1  ORF type:complete len:402 (+),score=108.51 TRINITY_DN6127_c2_g1_i2:71-1207(+)